MDGNGVRTGRLLLVLMDMAWGVGAELPTGPSRIAIMAT